MRSTTKNLALSLFALAFVQCGGGQTPDAAMPPSPPPAQAEMQEPGAMSPEDRAAMGMAGEQPSQREQQPGMEREEVAGQDLTDGQIVGILAAANQAEVQGGQMAAQKAQSNEVRQFASKIVQDHTQALQRQQQLSSQLGVNPEQSQLLSQLQNSVQSDMQQLQTATGQEFDRQYVRSQAQMHQMLLDSIDRQLVPSAENEQLRAFVMEIRPVIASHLEQARLLQNRMGSTMPGQQPGTGTTQPGMGQPGTGTTPPNMRQQQ